MLLWHATPRCNLDSIERTGLDPDYSRGRLRAVWLHRASQSAALIELVALRHQVDESEVVLIAVHVRRSQLRRFRRCLWYTCSAVPAERLLIPQIYRGDYASRTAD
jgi:hypothetical protein